MRKSGESSGKKKLDSMRSNSTEDLKKRLEEEIMSGRDRNFREMLAVDSVGVELEQCHHQLRILLQILRL